jgi:hypothetical protein
MEKTKFSPKEFLKGRRPEKFSDSIEKELGSLDRPVLEHYLDTLNKRSQELAFEDFAKKLCEKVICPNLLEQTGPVAGGDGKTDTQTFPVSEQNKLLWFEGVNDNSHKDRWAFAVSTRVDWNVKCKSDVRKIQGTDRGYKKAFFVCNQYVKSDQRAKTEDLLTKELGLDVIILDLSWILDQVYKNKLEQLTIDSLSIPVVFNREKHVGANDYIKNQELNELTTQINQGIDPQNITNEQVDWFLDVAILSAELEHREIEVEGLFERAVKISQKFGNNQQLLNAHYHFAWKSHFWYENSSTFNEHLILAFQTIEASTSSTKWEKVVTLLNVAIGHAKITGTSLSEDILEVKNKAVSIITDIAEDDTKPSNALYAQTQLIILELQSLRCIEDAESTFKSLHSIVKKSESLIGYPFEQVFYLISAVDDIFMENEAYEELLDYLTEQSSKRDGDVAASWNYLKRGAKRLESGKPYQAIKLVGKSLAGFYKEESSTEMIFAMRMISSAYEEVGLPWASRASMLFAASMLTDKYWKKDELSIEQVKSYIRLSWVELQLGRLGQSLLWFELAMLVQGGIDDKVINENEVINYDGCISHLILNTPFPKLVDLTYLPDFLDKLGLQNSRGMLLCALGYEEDFSREYEVKIDEKHHEFLIMVRDIELGKDIRIFNDAIGKRGDIKSYLLGGEISINYPQKSPFIELAESILAMLEGLLATAFVDDLIPIESSISIEIIADDDDEISITHEIEDLEQNLHIEITCSNFDIEAMNLESQHEVQQWFTRFSIDILSRAFYMKEPDKLLETMFKDDRVLERSLSFGTSFMALHNIQGHDFVQRVKKMFDGSGTKQFALVRNKPWDILLPKKLERQKVNNAAKDDGSFSSQREKIGHQDLIINGLIKPRLWDKAKWSGVGFSKYPNNELGLDFIFGNGDCGKKVIEGLRKELGAEDLVNRLRISIIKSVSVKEPNNYKIVLSENLKQNDDSKFIMSTSRIHTMTPSTLANLERFLSEFNTQKSFILGYGTMKGGQLIPSSGNLASGIKINHLVVVDAWQVGLHDLEKAGITSDDVPIIPEGVVNPPVWDVIKSRKSR